MAPSLLLALLGGGLVAAAAAASSPAPKKPAVPASPAKAALGGTLAGGKLVMSVGPAATLDPATEQALAVLKEATTPNRNWGTPGSAVNTLAATIRYAGGTSDAPPPVPGESLVDYDNRVLLGTWQVGSGAMGWVNAIADTIGGAAFNVASSVLQEASKEVDPTGTLAGFIAQTNAQVQAGLNSAKANQGH